MITLTEPELLQLAKDLTEALDDAVNGHNCHSLSQITGWCPAHCQTKIIDVLNRAKRSLAED